MKKTYKIEVDCANCAQKMEDAANTVAGVAKATVSFMTQKMIVEFREGAEATITPENAEIFLRSRDTGVSQSAITRMERQQAFLSEITKYNVTKIG